MCALTAVSPAFADNPVNAAAVQPGGNASFDSAVNNNDQMRFKANDQVTLQPNVSGGNSAKYDQQWYRIKDWDALDSNDTLQDKPLSEQEKIEGAGGTGATTNDAMKYQFYATCDDTMYRYMITVTNEAGTIKEFTPRMYVEEIWSYDQASKTLTIEDTGYKNNKAKNGYNMNAYDESGVDAVPLPTPQGKDSVENIVIKPHISSVDSFHSMVNVKRATIETSGTDDANVTIAKGAFNGDKSFLGMTLPENVVKINPLAYAYCDSMTDLTVLNADLEQNGFDIFKSDLGRGIDNKTAYESIGSDWEKYNGQNPNDKNAAQGLVGALYSDKFKYGRIDNAFGKLTVYGLKSSQTWVKNYNESIANAEYNRVYFVPISSDSSNLASAPIHQEYTVKNNEIVELHTNTKNIKGSLWIPKSINGYKVTKLNTSQQLNIFNENMDDNNAMKISEIILPEFITELDARILNVGAIGIQNFSPKTKMSNIEQSDCSNVENEYQFLSNNQFESLFSNFTKRNFLDISDDKLSGEYTSGIKWEISPEDHILNIGSKTSESSPGSTDNYTSTGVPPYAQAKDYIDTIIIQENVQSIGTKAYAGLTRVSRIVNYSQIINYISDSAFDNVGDEVNGKKYVKTVINNEFYDAITKKSNADTFKISFMTTLHGNAGNGVGFDYTVSNAKTGELKLYAQDGGSDALSADDVAQRCAAQTITNIQIMQNVPHIENFAFHNMTNLENVYNNARSTTPSIEHPAVNQTIGGTGEEKIFDIIKRDHIVNVYAYVLQNPEFSSAVPQGDPVKTSKGYNLQNIVLAEGKAGPNAYQTINKNNVLTIEGTGPMYDFTPDEGTITTSDGTVIGSAPWYQYRELISRVDIEKGITHIGNFAFEGLINLTSNVDSKQKDANGQDSIVSADINIGSDVSSFGICAFKDCTGINKFVFAPQHTSIGGGIFTGCSQLTLNNVTVQGKYSKQDGMIVDTSSKSIIQYMADRDGTNMITNYKIPDQYTKIEPYAFCKEQYIVELTLNKVLEIGEHAFEEMRFVNRIYCDAQSTTTDLTALKNAGFDADKQAVLQKSNTQLKEAAENAGQKIVYYDSLSYDHLTVTYLGDPIVVGQSLDLNKVSVDLQETGNKLKESGIKATDPRLTVYKKIDGQNIAGDLKINYISNEKTAIENRFYVKYDDGYGTIDESDKNTFVVPGINGIKDIQFKYIGAPVYIGNPIPYQNIIAVITYADNTAETISASASQYIACDKANIEAVGDNNILVIYNDTNVKRQGYINIQGKNWITQIEAKYTGSAIEYSSGVSGLNKNQLTIKLYYKDGSVVTTNGNDPRIKVSTDGTIVNNRINFTVNCPDDNPSNLDAIFSVPFTTNVKDVQYYYVGNPVTVNTQINKADIEVTLIYSNGREPQKVRADSLKGFSMTPNVITNGSTITTVTCSYEEAGQIFTGDIFVPGAPKHPVKLIVMKRPDKTIYQHGDHFDPTGIQVNVLFDNGSVQDVTNVNADIDDTNYQTSSSLTYTNSSGADIVNGTATLTKNDTFVTIVYYDAASNSKVSTNMPINMNLQQKELRMTADFKEEYAITEILFKSKATEDKAADNSNATEDEERTDEWIDITPPGNKDYRDGGTAVQAAIKAGYGFSLKVKTHYETNRGSVEFNKFLEKSLWDTAYINKARTDNAFKLEDGDNWNNQRYLNDVYPQVSPVANPDILYMRVLNGLDPNNPLPTDQAGIYNSKYYNKVLPLGVSSSDPDAQKKAFVVMERTDRDKNGNKIDGGTWYNNTKVFEFKARQLTENSPEKDRVFQVSRNAANGNQAYTDYQIQIVSPAQYGYEPEAEFNDTEKKFVHYNEEDEANDNNNVYRNKNQNDDKYLHTCVTINLRVTPNDDIHTHILQ